MLCQKVARTNSAFNMARNEICGGAGWLTSYGV